MGGGVGDVPADVELDVVALALGAALKHVKGGTLGDEEDGLVRWVGGWVGGWVWVGKRSLFW